MKKYLLVLILSVALSVNASASVCKNVKSSLQRKMTSTNKVCKNNTGISRLNDRLAKAKSDDSKARIQKQLAKAIFRQRTYCATAKSYRLTLEKITDFCKDSQSNNRDYCSRGFSLKIEDTEAISRCRKGRIWNDDFETCFLVDEYYYTSASNFEDDRLDPPGEILSTGRTSNRFYKLEIGTAVKSVSSADKCQ